MKILDILAHLLEFLRSSKIFIYLFQLVIIINLGGNRKIERIKFLASLLGTSFNFYLIYSHTLTSFNSEMQAPATVLTGAKIFIGIRDAKLITA